MSGSISLPSNVYWILNIIMKPCLFSESSSSESKASKQTRLHQQENHTQKMTLMHNNDHNNPNENEENVPANNNPFLTTLLSSMPRWDTSLTASGPVSVPIHQQK